ncbi:MAG TPA: oligopeptide transporter, OPT family [Myxococcaceae bacterium]|nr:oligopeptide transporter, OPT family [Myxococcaceae bacterium]
MNDPVPARATVSPDVPLASMPRELTVRGLVLGSVLGVMFAASSVYLAVKVGLTVSASIPVAVLSIAVFRALGRSSVLENCMVQTTGSAGESLAFGIAVTLPALLFMGYDLDLVHALLVALLGGILGVLMMIPLRHGLVVEEHATLRFPEGTACAEVLEAGERGGSMARLVVSGLLIGAVYKVAYAGFRLWREIVGGVLGWVQRLPDGTVVRHGFPGASVAVEISPELLGVGYIIGPRVAGITFAGGVLSFLVLIPMIGFFGEGLTTPLLSPEGMLIRDMGPDEIHRAYVLYIGAGAVAAGGLISLVRSLPSIVEAFRRGFRTFLASRRGEAVAIDRTEQDLPISIVVGGSLLLLLVIWLAPPLHVNFLSAVVILLAGFVFVTVSARITGEIGSSSNPISGMTVATLLATCFLYLLLGWTSPDDRFMALTTAAIVCIAASNGGTTAQDLKTAQLVGATPSRQQIALFVGVITSAVLIGPVLAAVNRGETATVPESHPGVRVTHPTAEQVLQREFPFRAAPGAFSASTLTGGELARQLWGRGLEVRLDSAGLPVAIRTFRSEVTAGSLAGEEVRAGQRAGEPGLARATLGTLGALSEPEERRLSVGYVRNDAPVPTGKYLSDAAGNIEYVVDPGIGGRVTEVHGVKLNRYEAPKARLFSLIVDGILTRKLPWDLVLLGVALALMLELCGVSALPFAVGVYLPMSTSAPLFVGGLVRWWVDRRRTGAESDASPGTLLASGYIAGGSLAGVVINLLHIPAGGSWIDALDVPAHLAGRPGWIARVVEAVGDSPRAHPVASITLGVVLFSLLALHLGRVALRTREANGPHPV